ncbi:response regulator transcription factor [Clostridium beijerinckii]|uniref:Stage 0 sporulation protein A homolog n=1 Tax=Clostridium beijerinckii TaxID=1520 RepID=A0AAX0B9N0_CLOBE|nr:response regulator transcription factor [Clostridium beijerinckii]MBA8933515.1 DNA-binding response OmpR family regulator [Clostridium beijerinckii]NOW05535.1 DNA-binding response OmpR family regulator [Clostridium beijerinckii]NRT91933.1 DNA-binding response OmpR family regulator [Clostridium beijerinckii]NRU37714.1 DNA-binding response OmpR family regulator [Clostridium beijerinckii]NSA99008.1 DNA-binding response OmpR family regulator [Clostridium beijerinckii]
MNESILLIDDEIGLLEMLQLVLEKEGFQDIQKAVNGREAIKIIEDKEPDLIIIDVMLPDISGFDLCVQIRKLTNVPILFLTSRTSDYDKLMGFGMGGDDYITKPFNVLEVVARIKAQLHRSRIYKNDDENTSLVFKDFEINKKSCELIVNGEIEKCTALEFNLLLFFVEHPNQIFTIYQLYENVWGQEVISAEKTVVMYISKIRKKIEKDSKYIINARGLGYKFIPY